MDRLKCVHIPKDAFWSLSKRGFELVIWSYLKVEDEC